MELLLVEDNERISRFLLKGLEESGFSVALAENGSEARSLLARRNWDVILLDIMLPDIDGMELLQYLRFKKINTPVLVVSALADPEDKVKALERGADDYLAKPFHFRELVARIHALLRRTKYNNESGDNVLVCDSLVLDVEAHQVKRGDAAIRLTLQEFKLLQLLMENKNRVVSRSEILEAVWGINYDTGTNVVDVYISYLRNKLDTEPEQKLIHTVKGRGYLIRTHE
ncbi:MAG: response regulator transcription factor [Dysgonamonadaceae bacterium]